MVKLPKSSHPSNIKILAYEVLSDPETRRKYDQLGPDFEKQQQQQGGHPFGDFFGYQ